jgi:F0F1-type ATP synthase assembly protein I
MTDQTPPKPGPTTPTPDGGGLDPLAPDIPPTPEPPQIPALLREPVARPGAAPNGASERRTAFGELGKAWGVAMEFVFTIVGGLLIGVGADFVLKSSPRWALAGLALGFVYALWRIIRRTLEEERARERAKAGSSAQATKPSERVR